MYTKLDDATRAALATELAARINAGTDPVEIRLYTSPRPATPATAVTTQTLLGTLECAGVSASDATVVFGTITDDPTADAGGTADWARVVFDDGARALDVDVTNEAGSGMLKLNTTTIVADGLIRISAFVLAVG